MNMGTPTHYSPNKPRVSSIVELAYPFEGTDTQKRYRNWLEQNDVDEDEYFNEAVDGGSFVHEKLEEYIGYINSGKLGKNDMIACIGMYDKFINNGIKFIYDYKPQEMKCETYFEAKEYQGTIDLICKIGKKKYIVDWKTWGLAKVKFGLKNDYRKPYEKLRKARLQLSLYAHAQGIKNIAIVELREDSYHFHELKLIPKKELNLILKMYLGKQQ